MKEKKIYFVINTVSTNRDADKVRDRKKNYSLIIN